MTPLYNFPDSLFLHDITTIQETSLIYFLHMNKYTYDGRHTVIQKM
jgi:hypothetical protein